VRQEASFLARSREDIRLEAGLDESLHIICARAFGLFDPTQVLLALHDGNGNQCRLYRISRSQEALQSSVLDSAQREMYFFPAPGKCWRAATGHSQSRNRFKCLLLKEGAIKKETDKCRPPDSFLTQHPFSLMLALSHVYESGWAVRFYALNPSRFVAGSAGLRFMERSLHKLSPVIHDAFLVRNIASRAKAAAGSHLARELHDGVIQSLSSIHMQLEEIRLQAASMGARGAGRIEHIQKCIREEITGLRDLTQQLRSVEIDSGRLLGFLHQMAMKFQCEHGIDTRFVSEVEEVPLRPPVCAELARIVLEALINIRKHSGADEAAVHLGRRDGHWLLRITDNGCGFDFSGRRTHEELRVSGKGPLILMERAQAIGGNVAIQSKEGGGTCLEITFPQDPTEI
jgi:two-component sensor histidine kinase